MPQIVKPGANITMTIKTQPDSLVSITATDMSSTILGVGNKIDQRIVLRDMRYDMSYTKVNFNNMPGKLSGLVTFIIEPYEDKDTGLKTFGPMLINGSGAYNTYDTVTISRKVIEPLADIDHYNRKDFPETWLFNDMQV